MSSKELEAMKAAVASARSGGAEREEQYFYYPARDAAGNGSAVIRFLPGKDEDQPSFVKIYSHGFKGPTGKWLIENCPTTIERQCPVCTYNSTLYARMSKEDARKYKMNRKTSFISRILVVEDSKNPENEGKVFLFKYGSVVFDKIADKISPAFEDEQPCPIFSLNNGADFRLKIRKVDGNANYDKSEFLPPSECYVKIDYTDELNISKFITEDKFKDDEKLEARLQLVIGNTDRVSPVSDAKPKASSYMEQTGDDVPDNTPPKTSRTAVPTPDSSEADSIEEILKSLKNS